MWRTFLEELVVRVEDDYSNLAITQNTEPRVSVHAKNCKPGFPFKNMVIQSFRLNINFHEEFPF